MATDHTGAATYRILDRELSELLGFAAKEVGAPVRLVPRAGGPGSGPVGDNAVPVRGRLPHGELRVEGLETLEPHASRFLAAVARLVADRLDRQFERTEAVRARSERVRRLLDTDALSVVYQPILRLRSGRVVGVEALARFSDGERSPQRWFAEAAAVGLSLELEVRAIAAAVEAFSVLPSDLYLSVNVSPAVAAMPQLRRHLRGVPLDRLVFEITEHDQVPDYEQLNRALQPLRRRGLRLAVDDAGAGFASLRHILRIHPDIIKLDRSLVRDIDRDTVLRALSYSISAFGSAVGASVVAEGIETQGELNALRFLGVDLGQGYLLQKPAALRAIALAPAAVSQTTIA